MGGHKCANICKVCGVTFCRPCVTGKGKIVARSKSKAKTSPMQRMETLLLDPQSFDISDSESESESDDDLVSGRSKRVKSAMMKPNKPAMTDFPTFVNQQTGVDLFSGMKPTKPELGSTPSASYYEI